MLGFIFHAALADDYGRSRRVNLMYLDDESFAIRYHLGMRDRREFEEPRLGVEEGCTGMAYKENAQIFGRRDFNLSKRNLSRVDESLLYVLSTPVRDPLNPDRILAIFNIDSNRKEDEALFQTPYFMGRMRMIADILGYVLKFNERG